MRNSQHRPKASGDCPPLEHRQRLSSPASKRCGSAVRSMNAMLSVREIAARANRDPAELTRRDVALGLLSIPAAQALDGLAALRRELNREGNPLSEAFWTSAEVTLTSIGEGRATIGDVRRFLEATGTEPIGLLPNSLFIWPDPEERGPVTRDMHARLVVHLETKVAEGQIDPDRLAEGDAAAWESYTELQREWLQTPLEDGTEPYWAVMEEEDEEFFAAWAEVDRIAREDLSRILEEVGERPLPATALTAACDRLRAGLENGRWPYDILAPIGGVAAEIPDDDQELWLRVAAGLVDPVEAPPEEAEDLETAPAWMSLQHADWLGAVSGLVRQGPGAPADPDSLAEYVVASEDVAVEVGDPDEEAEVLAFAFGSVVPLWQALGAVDEVERLTNLGWWGIPEALMRAWSRGSD